MKKAIYSFIFFASWGLPVFSQTHSTAREFKMNKDSFFELYGKSVSQQEFEVFLKSLKLKPGSAKSIETPTGGESIYNVKNKEGQPIEVRTGTKNGKEFGRVMWDGEFAEPLSFKPVESISVPGDLKKLLRELHGFGSARLGAVGGGPVPAGDDFLKALEIVKLANSDQLRQLIQVDNPQVRANLARAIAADKPKDFSMALFLKKDKTPIRIQSMNDIPPIEDEVTTVGEFVKKLSAQLPRP